MNCEGKERFTTFAMAEMVAKRRRREGTKRQPYRCACGAFHVGSTLGDARRPEERRDRAFRILETA